MPLTTGRAGSTNAITTPPAVTTTHVVAPAVIAPVEGRDAAVDLFDAAGTVRSVETPHTELPTVLMKGKDISVEHGTDPGDFYCEHAFYTLSRCAKDVGIQKSAFGEPQCGFLHLPWDSDTEKPADAPVDNAKRYARHRKVVGAALYGFFQALRANVSDPVRMLVTGYGSFQSASNNPSGGFVSSRDNIDAAMKSAFGSQLIGKGGTLLNDRAGGSPDDTMSLQYKVNDGGRVREIVVIAEKLQVADVELDNGDPGSLVGALKAVKPHAALSMGVHGGTHFLAEHHADDGGLAFDANGSAHHVEGKPPEHAFLDNYALARAIAAGGNRGPLRVSDARIGDV